MTKARFVLLSSRERSRLKAWQALVEGGGGDPKAVPPSSLEAESFVEHTKSGPTCMGML